MHNASMRGPVATLASGGGSAYAASAVRCPPPARGRPVMLRHPFARTVLTGVLLVTAVLALGVSVAPAEEREMTPEEAEYIAAIRQRIEERGLDWEAGPTSISQLSPERRRALLGNETPPHIQAIFDTLRPAPGVEERTYRSSFDWRDYDGVTPADDQLDCGSCWAFAACGATEAHIRINEGVVLDLSEQQSIDCNFAGSDCDGGWSGEAYKLHVDPGGVTEECYPYRAENGTSCRQNQCDKVAIIDDYSFVSSSTAAIKYAVETYGPVSTGMTVYDDLYGYTSGCYEPTGSPEGGHAVLIVGWDDSMCGGAGAWIVKNSWGKDWGQNGFFYIKYGVSGIGGGNYRPVNAHIPKERLVPDEYGTIGAALTAAQRGDIIRIAGGTYYETLNVPDYVSIYGGYSADFSERDPDAYPTIIDGGGSGHVVDCSGLDHIVIDGFTVRNSGGMSYGLYLRNSGVTVRNCEVESCWRGIGVVSGTGSVTEESAVIEYCRVHDNTGHGIYISDPDNPECFIRYVAAYDNGGSGISLASSDTDVTNCTIAGNTSDGLSMANESGNVVRDNIVASNGGYGITCSSSTPDNSYNDVWGNSSGNYDGCSAGTGSISDDPDFCDAASGDYSVHASSPTLGTGFGGLDMGALGIGCPVGPQNLELAEIGASIELEWSPPPTRADVDYYVVYRDTTQVPTTLLTTVDAPGTTFVDITVPACSPHNYWVSAVDLGGLEGAPSNKATGEVCYDGPDGLQIGFSEGANELAWSPAAGPVDYYVIERSTVVDPPDSVGWAAASETTFVDLQTTDCPRDNYFYSILPVYDTGWRGLVSESVGIDPSPSPPQGITAEWVGPDIVLNWQENCESDFRRYWIYRDTVPISPPLDSNLLVGFTPDTTFTDESPDPGTTYFYRLAASDAASQKSQYSETVVMGSGQVLDVPTTYATIQAAIDAASAIDTVLVSAGTYSENITLKDGVVVASSSGPGATTIQSGSGNIVAATGQSDLTRLSGFTIDGLGTATAGLECWGSYLLIEDCVFQNAGTGASFKYGGTPTLSECTVTGNSNGVAVADSSTPFLESNQIVSNGFSGVNVSGDPGPEIGRTLADANDIYDNSVFQVFNTGPVPVDADYNYWGDVCVGDSLFYGLVDYVPWTDEAHTETYTECPTGIDGETGKPFASYNYPNPFNPTTRIRYQVPAPGEPVRITVYDLSGRLVRTLVDDAMPAGTHMAVWHGRDDRGKRMSSGVYFYRIEIGDYSVERKMVMLK
ncbi:MAG: T9SS type A sorting domain-containing protein [Candidatus Eisenbacteria bacterium]|nr:T9SS type A sorting domain-containing protein [Candidatus Eisenbacteria bacterium]